MTDKAVKYLYDIQHSISLINNFLKDVEDFSDYKSDLKTQSAIERQF